MNSFDARSTLKVGDREYEIYRLEALQSKFDVARLPFALKVLLENLLRYEGGPTVDAADVEALATWVATDEPSRRSRTRPRASCSRTSPACRPSSTSPRCGTRCRSSAATRRASTRCSRPSS